MHILEFLKLDSIIEYTSILTTADINLFQN